jgi:TATA-box binding protein (TBP) (component of TFIID and TFIIIB)
LITAFIFNHEMIANINYKGLLDANEIKKIEFPQMKPPAQRIFQCSLGKLLVFRSGKFRLMGVKAPTSNFSELPFKVSSIELQSATVIDDLGYTLNLINLSRTLTCRRCCYEPELFPGLRLTEFNPMCVNVFASGKIMILGVKDLDTIFDICSMVHMTVLENIS